MQDQLSDGRISLTMPIRSELRQLYPPHWRALSSHVRFARAGGKCQRCGRPHLALVRCLPDGRWFDEQAATWRDRRGRPARWPDLVEATRFRITRVVLAAAHLDSDPTNNRLKNLRALCQRCHMLHDQPQHLAQRWVTYRRRLAVGDFFLGPYPAMITALKRTAGECNTLSRSPGNARRLRNRSPDRNVATLPITQVHDSAKHLSSCLPQSGGPGWTPVGPA
jgi:hypothetical protein